MPISTSSCIRSGLAYPPRFIATRCCLISASRRAVDTAKTSWAEGDLSGLHGGGGLHCPLSASSRSLRLACSSRAMARRWRRTRSSCLLFFRPSLSASTALSPREARLSSSESSPALLCRRFTRGGGALTPNTGLVYSAPGKLSRRSIALGSIGCCCCCCCWRSIFRVSLRCSRRMRWRQTWNAESALARRRSISSRACCCECSSRRPLSSWSEACCARIWQRSAGANARRFASRRYSGSSWLRSAEASSLTSLPMSLASSG
mmetsp:Transcript_6614/g.21352  ORF Transcript_6614/g.21352 Transcript_6614/m.21352 type:complete len:262 (+) Transcript_6614:793-1578(+)